MQKLSKKIAYNVRYFVTSRIVASKKNDGQLLHLREVPKPKSLPVLGTSLDLWLAGGGRNLHEYIDGRHKQLGPIFCENLTGTSNLVFVSDPSLIKDLFLHSEGKYPEHILPDPWTLYEKLYGSKRGLFFMNGEEWLNNRRLMNKFLLREDSHKLIEGPTIKTIDKFIQSMKQKVEQGGRYVPDFETEFYRLSTDVIIAILMGSNSSLKSGQRFEEWMQIFSNSVKKIFHTTTNLFGLPIEWCYKLDMKVWNDFKECVDMSLFLAKKIVEEMAKENQQTDGLLRKLCDENTDMDTITRIVVDFIIAAGDTTAYTLLWTLYLISINNSGRELAEQGPHASQYYVKEAMRLYPVAPFITRILPQDSPLGPYLLKKGTPIVASIYTSGRDEKYFSNSKDFLPYRWDRNDTRRKELENHIPSASLPFAIGARSCIGKKIATTMLNETVYQISNNFDIKCLNTTPVNSLTLGILVPEKPINLELTVKIKNCAENN